MNAKLTLATLIAVITLTAIFQPASAYEPTGKTGGKVTTHTTVIAEETSEDARITSTASTTSTRGAVIYVEPVRKVKHTDTPAVHIFDDGSTSDGQCLPGGSCNLNDDGAIIFEDGSWILPDGTTGCLPWGICNLE